METTQTFEGLNVNFTKDIIHKLPSFTEDFYLITNESDTANGDALQQKYEKGNIRPLIFFSRTLKKAKRNYSAVEREALGILYGINTSRVLILGYKIHILADHTYHRPVTWLLKSTVLISRIPRWQT